MGKTFFFIFCFVFFGVFNLSFAQTKYTLIFYNCKGNHMGMINDGLDSIPIAVYNNDSNQKIELKKEDFPGEYYFLTDKTDIRIETKNIFKQNIDTIIKLNKKETKHKICEDKFRDYELDTSVEKSFKTQKKWILEFSSMGCFHRNRESIELAFEKEKKYIIYKVNKQEKQRLVLNQAKMNSLMFFEKKLKLMNKPDAGCTTSEVYGITSDIEEYRIVDSSCMWFGK